MRATLIAIFAAAGFGMAGVSAATAAPINGGIVGEAAKAGQLSEQIHCRWYQHRHRNNVPHGWGRGCGARPVARPKPKK